MIATTDLTPSSLGEQLDQQFKKNNLYARKNSVSVSNQANYKGKNHLEKTSCFLFRPFGAGENSKTAAENKIDKNIKDTWGHSSG